MPFDEILGFAILGAFLNDAFYFEFFLVINCGWWWWCLLSIWEKRVIIFLVGFQEIDMEDWVYVEFSF